MRGDVVIVGGGLAGGLVAYRLAQVRPETPVVLLEESSRLGGAHTWSFHTSDLAAEERAWIAPFVVRSWSGYDVRFPGHARHVGGGYHSVSSARFHEVVSQALGDRVRLNAVAGTLTPDAVAVGGGRLDASCVIDARGFPTGSHVPLGYQKFLGRHLRLAAPHGLASPRLMDAAVAQLDGFRFVYVLPWDETSLLVEDTRYSDGPDLDESALGGEIERYAEAQGWRVAQSVGEERGVLPIPLAGSVEAFAGPPSEVPRVGVRAGLFHPTTGYSLPEAVRVADAIAARTSLDSRSLAAWAAGYARARWRSGTFLRFLNRMLFRAAEPEARFRVLERFYRLPEETIHRFYANTLTAADRVRVLVGRPPVPLARAARCLFEAEVRP
jgi:lycopene beta-cyclase